MTGQQLRITTAGRAALVADDHRGTTARRVTEIGLGVSHFDFDPTMSALPGERKRVSTFGGDVVAVDTIHVVIQDDTDDAYSLRAFGLYLDDGTLFGVYTQADPILEKTAATILLLAGDVQLTTIDAALLQFGPASFLNPPATTEIAGVIELATQDEVDHGSDATRAVTPKAAAQRYAPRVMPVFSGPVTIKTPNNDSPALDILGRVTVDRNAGEGQLALGKNAGYFFANETSAGYWSPEQGHFKFIFADRSFLIDGARAWHDGNLKPLDVAKGGAIDADVSFAPGRRLILAEGSANAPSLTFANDYAADTGMYHEGDGVIGFVCNREVIAKLSPGGAEFTHTVTAPTPALGDRSKHIATTEWVASSALDSEIGRIVIEPRSNPRPGYLKLNGALVMRADYPALWTYALNSGALVSDANWQDHNWGNFSDGDGATTFRLPDMRGEFIRGWDDGRGIDGGRIQGSWQDSLNRSHGHGAWASQAPDHVHSAWSGVQGAHTHGGSTSGVGDHQHVSPFGENSGAYQPPWGTWGANNQVGTRSGVDFDNVFGLTSWAGGHSHSIYATTNGNHSHDIAMGAAGSHTHDITVNADGGNEARPRNIALLVMIRAY